MDRAEELALVERLLALVASRRSDMGPAPARLDPALYTDPARLDAERALLRRLPLVVGFSAQLRRPGDFLTHADAGVPILVVRTEEGLLAFLNACRHRGVRLLTEEQGTRARFTCRFHGWTYDHDGRLRTIPEPEGFTGCERERLGLVPLWCEERHGLIFVIPTPGLSVDLDAFLGPRLAELGALGLAGHEHLRPSTHRRAFNWKMYLDVTLESYHIPSLHSSTGGAGWFARIGAFDRAPPHARAALPDPTIVDLEHQDPMSWRLRDHAGLLYMIFPNTTVLVHRGFAQVMSAFPVDPHRAVLRGAMLAPPAPSDEEALTRKGYYETYWKTMEEDFEVCESLQLNLQSGVVRELWCGRQEYLVAAFHEELAKALEGSAP